MNVLMLDFDGVLNTPADYLAPRYDDGRCPFNPMLITRLNGLVERVSPIIVLCSSWRGFPLPLLDAWLREAGYAGPPPADRTPNYRGDRSRGDEIAAWLHNARALAPRVAILDDSGDMGGLLPRLARVNPGIGLSDADVERAVALWEMDG